MKIKIQSLLIMLACFASFHTLFAQGTAFTYQGRLIGSDGAANGTYDFKFAVFNTNQPAGILIAGPLTNAATVVSNGLFTVMLDFGPGIFTGPSRWLEISVQTNGGSGFGTLSPRQPLTPSPYAIFANTASNVSGTVSAAQVSGGTLGNAVLPGSPNFSGTVTAGSFSGNGANVTNVNAALLNGKPAANFWQTTGNAGTSPTNGNFLGTTDSQPLELRVNSNRGLRLEFAAITNLYVTNISANIIGGYVGNVVTNGFIGSFIAGGSIVYPNYIGANFGSIPGGERNIVTGEASLAAGFTCTAAGDYSIAMGEYCSTAFNALGAIALGSGSAANNEASTALGAFNIADGWISTVLGGFSYANGDYAMAMGRGDYAYGNYSLALGTTNTVNGNFSAAMGNLAVANHDHVFVWSDGAANTVFSSTTTNQFAVRATGGVLLNAGTNNVEIASGGIKVTGAGVGTSTTAFIHRATAANIEPGNLHRTTINNPYCNGNANALLFVTANYNPGNTGNAIQSHPYGVYYNPGLAKWQIFNEDFVALTTNTAFNVMIVVP